MTKTILQLFDSLVCLHNQKFATHQKEQNKTRFMKIGQKIKKLIIDKKCQKNAQKTQNFQFKNT